MKRTKHTITRGIKVEGDERQWDIVIEVSIIPQRKLSKREELAFFDPLTTRLEALAMDYVQCACEVIP